MEVVNCPRCGKLFNRISDSICPNCIKAEEALFQSVKEYIREHDNCTLKEVAEATGVSHKKIMTYIRDGRLEISKGMQADVKCDLCGKPITRGRYCDTCYLEVSRDLNAAFNKKQSQSDRDKVLKSNVQKMHISTNNK